MSSPAYDEDLESLFGDPLDYAEPEQVSLLDDSQLSSRIPALYLPTSASTSLLTFPPPSKHSLCLPPPPPPPPPPAAAAAAPPAAPGGLHLPALVPSQLGVMYSAAGSPIDLATSPESSAASPGADEEHRQRRKNKPRVNWTDQESEKLLKGVELHGIGNWAKIRADPQFELGHRKNVDLKDRFRTVFPEEYRKHNNIIKSRKGLPVLPGPQVAGNGGSVENPIILELDYQAARRHKKLNRKRTKHKESVERDEVETRQIEPVSVALTTATGRRKVTTKKGTPWTAEEDADLPAAFNRHKRRWRSIAADRSFSFYGRAIADIRSRFGHLFPDQVSLRTMSASPEPDPQHALVSTFEQGLVNSFGTTGVSRRQARRISSHVVQNNQQKALDNSQAAYPASPVSLTDANTAGNLLVEYAAPAGGTYSMKTALSMRQFEKPPQGSADYENIHSIPQLGEQGLEQIQDFLMDEDLPEDLELTMSPTSIIAGANGANSSLPTPITSFSGSPVMPNRLDLLDSQLNSQEQSPIELDLAGIANSFVEGTPTPKFPDLSDLYFSNSAEFLFEPLVQSIEDQACGSPTAV
ncbi:hypothetical protein H072_9595 [Dactylellina haptotyla CBS 200.50]|uniref:Myb-like domain-containing protein n=1 Tax=Dactylellina haptotyla (strain CBS 200.50) TaxID=1284197 RepID=S8A182_DACHA|nr:hypothetical protein H072_9595 [Dactylellina haptotyla CBS 200.50]